MGDSGHVFISYDPEDGTPIALQIARQLGECSPPITPWVANLNLTDPELLIDDVSSAIRRCSCYLLVVTPAVNNVDSRSAFEWKLALRYRKAIVLAVSNDSDIPPRLDRRSRVRLAFNGKGDFEALHNLILETASFEGRLKTAQCYLDDAEWAKKYAAPDQVARIDAEIEAQRFIVNSLSDLISDPQGVGVRVEQRIHTGIERERIPRAHDEVPATQKYINAPPVAIPTHFQGRSPETRIICEFLRDESKRLLVVTGRGGVGKSALVCRILRSLERGTLPENHGSHSCAGIVYLSHIAQRHPTFKNLIADLAKLLSTPALERLRPILDNSSAPASLKTRELLGAFPREGELVVVLLDNMEEVIDQSTFSISDPDLVNFIEQIIASVRSPVKLIMTSRVAPKDFVRTSIATQVYLPLEDGLASPYAENVFRALDAAGTLGLKNAPDSLLNDLRVHTRGFPRAIEAVFMILSADRDTTIKDILASPASQKEITKTLVGEAFDRLDQTHQMVVIALAVFNRPVRAPAVDYLLRPWLPYIDAALSLKHLVHTLFVRKDGDLYYLHPVDAQHALRSLNEFSHVNLNTQPFDRPNLLKQAADYFSEIQVERSEWSTLDDVEAFVSEFRIRVHLGDDISAAGILSEISEFLDRRGAFQLLTALGSELAECAASPFTRITAYRAKTHGLSRLGYESEAKVAQERVVENATDPDTLEMEKFNLGIHQRNVGEFSRALDAFNRYQKFVSDRPWNNLRNGAWVNFWLGECNKSLGYLRIARKHQEEALTIARRLGDKNDIEAQLHNLAAIVEDIGEVDLAINLYSQALALAAETGNPLWKSNHLHSISALYYDKGNIIEAGTLLDEATRIKEGIGDLGGIASVATSRASRLLREARLSEAKIAIIDAISLEKKVRPIAFGKMILLSRIHAAQGDWREAERWIRESLATNQEEGTAYRLTLLGIYLANQDKIEDALSHIKRAMIEAQEWVKRCEQGADAQATKGLTAAALTSLGLNKRQVSIASYVKARTIRGLPGDTGQRMVDFNFLPRKLVSDLADIERAIKGVNHVSSSCNKHPTTKIENDLSGHDSQGFDSVGGMPAMSTQTDWNMLNGPQIRVLSEAVMHAFPLPDDFDVFLFGQLNEGPMQKYVKPDGYEKMVTAFFLQVRGRGWLDRLVSRMQSERKNNPLVRNLARTIHLAGSEPDKRFPPDFGLEAIAGGGGFSDIRQWLQAMAEISEATCRIEAPADTPWGTGILVSPNYVLTNYHVAKKWSDDKTAVCRFGFAADPAGKAAGQATALTANGAKAAISIDDEEAAKSNAGGPVLDFALLRLAQPMKAVKPIAMRVGNTASNDSPALIVQHPSGSPQKLAIGKFMGVSGERWQYDADTEPGSSGSGVFNQKLELVALHHAGHEGSPSTTGFNQGISINAIIDLLRQKQEIPKFW